MHHAQRFAFDRIFTAPPHDPPHEDAALELAALRVELTLLRDEQAMALTLARAEGFEAGLAQARGEREVALLSAVDALQASLESVEARFDEVEARVTEEAAQAALAIAETLAARALALAPGEAIDQALGRALRQVARGTELHVRVNPALADDIEARVAARQAADRRRLRVQVVPEAGVAVGDCQVAWEQGGLALDAAARRAEVLAELEGLVGR